MNYQTQVRLRLQLLESEVGQRDAIASVHVLVFVLGGSVDHLVGKKTRKHFQDKKKKRVQYVPFAAVALVRIRRVPRRR